MTEMEKMLLEQNKQLIVQIALLTEQVQVLTQKLYGRSSEKSTPADENQINLFNTEELNVFNEAEVVADKSAVEPKKAEQFERKRRTPGHKARLIKDLPVIEVDCLLPKDDSKCEWCNTDLRPIGREYIREEVEFIPAHLKVRKIYRHAYECPCCKKDGADAIVKAELPRPVIPKSLASASSVAWLFHQKYEMSLPFHRQEKEWQNYGIALSRTTMANWVIKAAELWLKPLYNLLHQKLLTANCLFVDETTTQVLREPDRKATSNSYMWLYRNSTDVDQQIILYQYSPTRAGENAEKFLSGYTGYIHCDGYEGYNKVKNVTRVGCLAHIRRKFHEGVPKTSTGKKSQCEIGLDYCNALFSIEKEIAHLPPEERLKKRKKKAIPVLKAFWGWVETTNALPSSVLGKALSYAKKQKPYLMNYLLDGECQISNNLAERSIRPFVVGRKAWNFYASPKGAESSSIAYSIIETAKANNLNVFKYLTYLFKELPNTPFKEEPELLEDYLPWNENVQANCK